MPKQKRWRLKRQLEQAENDLDRCQRNLIIVAAEFKGVHEQYFEALSLIVMAIEHFKDSIVKVKDLI
ncbi:hypothetical protein ES708_11578 [subsurface metagenome]